VSKAAGYEKVVLLILLLDEAESPPSAMPLFGHIGWAKHSNYQSRDEGLLPADS